MNAKEHIMYVAENLFFKKGFHLTTTRDIASEANINVSMINYYFHSKEELYLKLFDKLDDINTSVQYFYDEKLDMAENVKNFALKSWNEAILRPKIVHLFLVEQLQPSSTKSKNRIGKIIKLHFKCFNNIFEESGNDMGQRRKLLLYVSIFGITKEFFLSEFVRNDNSNTIGLHGNELIKYISSLTDALLVAG